MTMPLKDLIFELSDAGQPKICIAVCDSREKRKRLTQNILANLDKENVKADVFLFDASLVDVVARLQEHLRSRKIDVAVFDGLENLEEKTTEFVLAKLNFRRDILAGLNVSILLWVTNSLLKLLIARAPDFWSRRTATYFFNRVEVKEYLKGIFGQESIADDQALTNRKISRALRMVLSNEAEINKLVKASKCVSPLQIDKLARAINMGVESLIHDSNDGKNFIVTMKLWNLAELDEQVYEYLAIQRVDRNRFYDYRTSAFYEVAEQITSILDSYKKSILPRVNKQQAVALLSSLEESVIYSAKKIIRQVALEEYKGRQSLYHKAVVYSSVTIDEEVFYEGAKALTDCLASDAMELPGFFDESDAMLLRILYNETKNVTVIARKLKISEAKTKKRLAELKAKVCAFLGAA